MPLRGAGIPGSFPWETQPRPGPPCWVQEEEAERSQAEGWQSAAGARRLCRRAGGGGRTNCPLPSGAADVVAAALRVIVSWKRLWEKGPARWVGKLFINPLFLLVTLFISALFNLVTLSCLRFQKKRKCLAI